MISVMTLYQNHSLVASNGQSGAVLQNSKNMMIEVQLSVIPSFIGKTLSRKRNPFLSQLEQLGVKARLILRRKFRLFVNFKTLYRIRPKSKTHNEA